MFGSFSFSPDADPTLPGHIGVMGAMPQETKLIDRAMAVRDSKEIARRVYATGSLEGIPTTAVFSRWGKVAAAATTATLIEQFGAELVLFVGVAGAVDPALEIGDVVIGQNLWQHDMDVSQLPQFSRYEIPLLDVMSFSSLPQYTSLAVEAAKDYLAGPLRDDVQSGLLSEFGIMKPKAVLGDIATGDQFVHDAEHVARLRRDLPKLQCVEMEGAAMAQVAHEHGVPFVVMRIISDKADHSAHLDFPRFIEEVSARMSAGLVKNFYRKLKAYDQPRA